MQVAVLLGGQVEPDERVAVVNLALDDEVSGGHGTAEEVGNDDGLVGRDEDVEHDRPADPSSLLRRGAGSARLHFPARRYHEEEQGVELVGPAAKAGPEAALGDELAEARVPVGIGVVDEEPVGLAFPRGGAQTLLDHVVDILREELLGHQDGLSFERFADLLQAGSDELQGLGALVLLQGVHAKADGGADHGEVGDEGGLIAYRLGHQLDAWHQLVGPVQQARRLAGGITDLGQPLKALVSLDGLNDGLAVASGKLGHLLAVLGGIAALEHLRYDIGHRSEACDAVKCVM